MPSSAVASGTVAAERGRRTRLKRVRVLKKGFRLEPNIVYIWGFIGPDRPPNPSKKVEGGALHMIFGSGLNPGST
jgi:hypothetical protein